MAPLRSGGWRVWLVHCEFLGRLVEMRSRPIRDVAQYREVVWLADLPAQPEVRLGGQAGDEGEPWLSVDRPRPSVFPEPPALLRPWIDLAELREPTAEPELRASTLRDVRRARRSRPPPPQCHQSGRT